MFILGLFVGIILTIFAFISAILINKPINRIITQGKITAALPKKGKIFDPPTELTNRIEKASKDGKDIKLE